MKKYIFIILLVNIFISCKAPVYNIGMNEQDFIRQNKVSAVRQTKDISIYKKVNYPFGTVPVVKFFYFTNGKLIQVDEGQRSVDYRIKVD